MNENIVEVINGKYIIVTLFKKVWYKKLPIKKIYVFRGLKNKYTNELWFNGYETNKQAEIEIYKRFNADF